MSVNIDHVVTRRAWGYSDIAGGLGGGSITGAGPKGHSNFRGDQPQRWDREQDRKNMRCCQKADTKKGTPINKLLGAGIYLLLLDATERAYCNLT